MRYAHIDALFTKTVDWIALGGSILKSGDPVEQVKQIKYMNLVANAVMLHNVVDLTEVLINMDLEKHTITKELVSRLSPYMREHIRRFGPYVLNMEEQLPPIQSPSLYSNYRPVNLISIRRLRA
jgi:Tn3 transposase DDE domain